METAVEWLQKEIKAEVTRFLDGEINKPLLLAFMSIAETKAKEMEKQQIINAGNMCALKQLIHNEIIESMTESELIEFANRGTKTVGEQYYNEQFKKETSEVDWSDLENSGLDKPFQLIEEPTQRLEKYSERFNNDKSAIGNPETWGKRMVNNESKQETQGYICPQTKIQCDDECCVSAEDCHIISSLSSGIVDCDPPNQETLEEAALKYASEKLRRVIIPYKEFNANVAEYVGFVNGAKWQQKRMYSEKEVQVKLYECLGHFAQKHKIVINGNEIDHWFKTFKKQTP